MEKAKKLSKMIHTRKRIISGIYQKGNRTTALKSILARSLQLLPESPKWFEWPYMLIEKYKNKPSKYMINVYGAAQPLPSECFDEVQLYKFEPLFERRHSLFFVQKTGNVRPGLCTKAERGVSGQKEAKSPRKKTKLKITQFQKNSEVQIEKSQ